MIIELDAQAAVAFDMAQQRLIDTFKEKLKQAADDTLSTMYTDVTNHASTDAHINYHNYLRDELKASFIKEVATEYGIYSWAHSIRMELLKHHRVELQNKTIEDLQNKIERLEQEISQLHDRHFR